jgi:hypothetical protein
MAVNNHAENRGGAGEAQDQRDQRDERETRILAEHSQPVANVLEQRAHRLAITSVSALCAIRCSPKTRPEIAFRSRSNSRLDVCRCACRLCDGSGLRHRGERKINWLLRELPDRGHSAQDEEAVSNCLEQTAFFFFRPNE